MLPTSLPITETIQLERIIRRHGLRPTLETIANFLEEQHGQENTVPLEHPDGEHVQGKDLLTAAENLRRDLY